MDIQKILSNIGFDWRVAVANLVNFLVIFYLLKRFAFKPIQKTLNARRAKIDEGLENAEKARTELLMAKEVAKRELDATRIEANDIIAAARIQEQSIIAAAKKKAENESEKILKSAESQIAKDRSRLELELRRKTIDLVIEGLERIVPGEIDKKRKEELINQLVG